MLQAQPEMGVTRRGGLFVRGCPSIFVGMAQTVETLARIPLFRSLDEDAIRRLDAACTWRRTKREGMGA